ncbi:MAG: peptidoglycan-binding protein [Candidatus Dormibacteraeota bacterium]|nr:peptidoglycan-binding protein [Candidatus Dormibacteraeota bacterium]
MTTAPSPVRAGDARPPGRRQRRRRPRRLLLAVPALVLVAVLGLGTALYLGDLTLPSRLPWDPFAKPRSNNVSDNNAATSLTTVQRRGLSSQITAAGTLGYGGDYSVINQFSGTLTALPSVGQTIDQGHVLYQVDGAPVVLLYGSTPAYRDLAAGSTGPDVQELNADLVALGYVSSADLSPRSDLFTLATEYGVDKLQAALGRPQTGTVTLGQVVFLPSAVRITSIKGTVGAAAGPGQPVLEGTSTARQVTMNLDAGEQSYLAVGDSVEISLPNGRSTPGTVSSVGTVATSGSSGGSPTVPVVITPTDATATGSLDQAPVNVTITTETVKNVLVVPVAALLARPGEEYAVEVVDRNGRHHLVTVSLGLFDDADGLVQVTGNLQAGERIVVPAT